MLFDGCLLSISLDCCLALLKAPAGLAGRTGGFCIMFGGGIPPCGGGGGAD